MIKHRRDDLYGAHLRLALALGFGVVVEEVGGCGAGVAGDGEQRAHKGVGVEEGVGGGWGRALDGVGRGRSGEGGVMGGGWGWHIVDCGWILGVRLVVGLGVVGGCRLVSGLRFGLLLMADKQCLIRFF